MRPFQLSDLRDDHSLVTDEEGLRTYLSSRTVLITGAGGSIGRTLCRALADLSPGHLALVDFSEHNLYVLDRALSGHSVDYTLHFADVSDPAAVARIFRQQIPSVMIHAAAYKHVHLMERHPRAAFRNNTLATVRLLDRSEDAGVEQFVYISTDKAVAPRGVLGRAKQLSEWYVRATHAAASSLSGKAVRFGNVFRSRGSVVPLFERQIEEGGPLTFTHPDMTRYFMSDQEAASLILETLLLDAGPTYAFRMGDPVRIEMLARQLVKHHHPNTDPDDWIEQIGPRPGEKLQEHLVASGEQVSTTAHPDIVALHASLRHDRSTLNAYFQHLTDLHRAEGADALKRALLADTEEHDTEEHNVPQS
jgi:FlaA1/EpsC-like NDP-sugar epimerase